MNLLTPQEAADRLRIKTQSLRDPRYRQRLGLKAIRIGGVLRFSDTDIEALIRRGTERLPLGVTGRNGIFA